MLSGVSKSGSPADSEMMSRPLAFSSRAFVDIPMVWDGEMRFTLSAKKPMGCLDWSPSSPRRLRSARDPTPDGARVKAKTRSPAPSGMTVACIMMGKFLERKP